AGDLGRGEGRVETVGPELGVGLTLAIDHGSDVRQQVRESTRSLARCVVRLCWRSALHKARYQDLRESADLSILCQGKGIFSQTGAFSLKTAACPVELNDRVGAIP